MPSKTNGPPTIAVKEMFSEKKKKANIEAIIGSPKGTDATAVGERYFTEYVNKLCPKMEGKTANTKNQKRCSLLKLKGFVPSGIQTRAIVKAATTKAVLLYVIESVSCRALEA